MLKLYNTLTRKKQEFKPIKKGLVSMYTCGPTVYDYAHIGNFRAYISADILRRYLEYKGLKVKQVMNLTDVDDKTIKKSKEQGIKLADYTKKYKDAFFDDVKKLNIKPADIYPEATRHIKEMTELVKRLMKNGYAYKGDDGSIYYDISKFKDYGKLAHTKIKELKAGARVRQDEYEKEKANDFALWKSWDKADGDVFWKTELGKGRPGWHIECSAMSIKHLGKNFDIHTGGTDLIFPHHENEIAQSVGAGNKFVNFWIHNEWLLVEGKKMSKSLGNFYTLRDLINKGYGLKSIRYVLLATHYQQKLNFTLKGLEAAKKAVQRLIDFTDNLKTIKDKKDNKKIPSLIKKTEKGFERAMDDDLNISIALAAVFDFIRDVNKLEISEKDAKKVYDLMIKFDKVLGVIKHEKGEISDEVKVLIEKREKARNEKNFKLADKIRNELSKKGIILEDTKHGVRWKRR